MRRDAGAEAAEEGDETEEEDKTKKKKRRASKKKSDKEAEGAETPKPKRARKGKKTVTVPKAGEAILKSIDKGDKEQKKDEAQEVRSHIQKDLMWPSSLHIHLDRLYTPHWMWRDRDLFPRHVEMIKQSIIESPLKIVKPPIVQPVRLA